MSSTFTVSRDQIIKQTLIKLNVLEIGDTPDAAIVQHASLALNLMIKSTLETKSSCKPSLALNVVPWAIKPLSSLISNLLLIFILSFSIRYFNLAHAAILLPNVVLNPLRNLRTCPLRIGSLKKSPGKFSSPISLITIRAASPSVLFSTE